jgi:beta-glucosidase
VLNPTHDEQRLPSAMRRALSNSDLATLSGVEVGVATSSFQCEGALDQPASPQSNWSEWQRLGRVEPIGAACDLWRRFPLVVERLNAMGASVFRLSFEWSRLCPDGPEIDAVAAREYASRLASLSAVGITPIVTLQHFTHPAWLGADFWLDRGAPQAFADYARRALAAVQSALRAMGAAPVTRVITINEPNMLALATWGAGVFPHGAPSLLEGSAAGVGRSLLALDHMLSAHVLAYDALHALHETMALPRPDVSINVNLVDLYSLGAQWLDALRTGQRSARDRQRFIDARRARFERCFIEPDGERSPRAQVARALEIALRGPLALEAFDRLSRELSRRGAAPALDSRAFDLYDPWTRNQARGIEPHLDQLAAGALQWQREHAAGAPHQRSPSSIGPKASVADAFEALSRSTFALAEPWEWRVEPEMMVRSIDALHDPDDPIPIDVMENGMSVRRDPGSSTRPRQDGATRPAFIREYTAAFAYSRCVLARPARTYAHWTLVDNYELGRWAPRFGLFGLGDEERGQAAQWSEKDASGDEAASALRAFAEACRDPEVARRWAAPEDG